MSKDVFVFIEQRDSELQKVGIELLGEARKLADSLNQDVVAMLLGYNIKSKAEMLIHHGANKVIVVDDEILNEYVTEPYAKAVCAIIKKYDPEIVLYGASSIGRDLAPRLASRIHTGLTADCTALEIDEESKNLLMTRPAFGGNLMATILCENHRPQMATVRPGVMKKLPKSDDRKGEIVDFPVTLDETKMKVKLLNVVKEGGNKVDISEAKILVSGGRGVGAKQNFELLENLAAEIGGIVSSSRAQVDAGNMPHDRQVGQTGKTVRPEVYFACGISGAIQHVAGMEESEFIIAINKDRFAPIFSVADLGIVGDLHKILPILTEEIKKYKATK